jgi:hypothetical protein
MGEVLRFMHCDGSGGSGEPVARLVGVPGR